jgi:hypothetical protein
MKQAIALAVIMVFAAQAQAQTSYDRGYNDGYYDHTPLSGTPDPSTEYGRGWRLGQDDADEEFDRMMPHVDQTPPPLPDLPSGPVGSYDPHLSPEPRLRPASST